MTPSPAVRPTPRATTEPSDRFGVAGVSGRPDLLGRVGVRWYYDYTPNLVGVPAGLVKIGMVRGGEQNRIEPERLAALVPRDRPSYWLIFNEPDLEEQDKVSDAYLAGLGEERFQYYARRFHEYRQAIKTANPSARLVGPNLFNLGEGFRDWIDAFRAAHRTRYGAEPEFDVWATHVYYLDWRRQPMVSLDYARRHVDDFIEYVRQVPGAARRPIWISEFGTLWAWREPPACLRPDCACASWAKDGRCATRYAVPANATFATVDLAQYLTATTQLFASRGIERWFVFTSFPTTDPPFVAPAGCANGPHLLTPAGELTPLGSHYRALSLGLELPPLPPEQLDSGCRALSKGV